MSIVRFAAFAVEQLIAAYGLLVELGWQFVTYSAGPVPVGAVAFVLLWVAIISYGVDPPMHV